MKRVLAAICVLLLQGALGASPLFSSVAVEEEEIVFRLAGVDTGKVYLVGDFNGWNPTMDLMVPTGAGFQLRLYLVPGKYRYRFVVNGVSKADPDNPCLDADGNSCFTLAERNGALEIISEGRPPVKGSLERAEIQPVAHVSASASKRSGSLYSTGGVAGSVDGKISVDLSVGWTESVRDGETPRGESFLLRSFATYQSDRGRVTAFTRSGSAIEPGDPLQLFGRVGPYRYPLGLFCRGAQFDGKLPLGVDAWLMYSSRLTGYRSGPVGLASPTDLFSGRELVDSDLIGMKFQTKLGAASLRYLFRQDRRPKDGFWRFPSFGGADYRGFERARVQGLWLSIAGSGSVTLDGELLLGRNFLSARDLVDERGMILRGVSLDGLWERGRRMYVGVSGASGSFHSRLSLVETTLEGDSELRDGRLEGLRTGMNATLSYQGKGLVVDLAGKLEQYSAGNTGAVFWLSRTNFWLDGDEVSYDLVPFLSSTELYEARIACAWNYRPFGELPWGRGLKVSLTQRGDAAGGTPLLREAVLSSGVAVHPRVTLLVDMRGVSYRYGDARRDFVDVFLSAHGTVTPSLWVACGVGVDPYAFDPWLYAFSDHGREEYLAERGILSGLAARGEAASVNALIDAEEALSEDWVVTFEAGFTF